MRRVDAASPVVVLDASAAIDLVLRTTDSEPLTDALSRASTPWHAPHLIDAEVTHVVRRFARDGVMSSARGALALEFLLALPVARHDAGPLLPRVWSLRDTMTAYDAMYVALAEALGATLFTRDQRLARAAHRLIPVEIAWTGTSDHA